jgi:MFS family permease
MDAAGGDVPVSVFRLSAASAVGTTLEWYDFTVYNVMAALVFNTVFFPTFDPMAGTLLAFATYAVGYCSRPVGGILFGHLGDRRGRRIVLVATLVLMGVATLLIGLLPSYAHWGVWSAALRVLLRFAQGAAIGGEWAGAVAGGMILHAAMYGPQAAFIAEQFPARVRYAGSSMAYTLTGVVAGGLAPLVFSALYRAYGSTTRLSIYVIAALSMTLLALGLAPETARRPLAEH